LKEGHVSCFSIAGGVSAAKIHQWLPAGLPILQCLNGMHVAGEIRNALVVLELATMCCCQ
jgi:hypothetical protein